MSETQGQQRAEDSARAVLGKELTGIQRGFGQLWQKTYEIGLTGSEVRPRDVIRAWKGHFPAFWPPGNKFFRAATGPLKEGDVAEIGVGGPAGVRVWTGIAVIHADDDSFSFMTPQGHMLGGTITFVAREQDGVTYAQVRALVRASDPLWELGFRLGLGHETEDLFWHRTLQNLARYFGASGHGVTQESIILDPRMQWSQFWNVRHNAALHTFFGTPVRLLRKLTKRGRP
jgi:hypothetical protein